MPPEQIALAPIRAKHLPRFRRASVEERPTFRLTDRDREGLKIIYENRWITAEMLQDLLPPVVLTQRQQEALGKLIAAKKANAPSRDTGERPQGTKREIRRRLQMMYHHGYVQRHKVSDRDPIAYALGNLGADELVLHYGIDRKEIDWTTKNRECGEPYIRHALLVTRFRHALEMALRHFPEATLEKWIPGGAFTAKVTYQDRVRTRDGTRTQPVDGIVKPDAVFVLRVGASQIHYFLEADRSTMTNARYQAKLKAYYAFWASYVKSKNKAAGITQMRVLTVTISEARKDNLRDTADEVSDEAKNLFWFICEKVYHGKPQEVLGPNWQTLEDDSLKRLYNHG